MRVRAHIITSSALSGILYFIFKSFPMAAAAFLAGVFIDLDHVLEGYINFGRKFNIFKTIEVSENARFKTAYLFLHSYELLLIYTLAAYFLKLGPVWFGIAVGLIVHMVLDNTFNPFYPNGLFFIKRWQEKFKYARIINIDNHLKRVGNRKKK